MTYSRVDTPCSPETKSTESLYVKRAPCGNWNLTEVDLILQLNVQPSQRWDDLENPIDKLLVTSKQEGKLLPSLSAAFISFNARVLSSLLEKKKHIR